MKTNIVISLVCLLLLALLVNQNRTIKRLQNNFTNANNHLTIVKDKYNREVATSNILQLEKKELAETVLIYKSKYQLELTKPSKISYISNTVTETIHDTVIQTKVSYIDSLPIYTITDSSQWHYINVIASADSSKLYWKITNQYISTHYNSSPFWKAPQYKIQTINLNPHTRTKEQHSYTIKPKRANRLIWFGCGLLTSFILQQ